MVYDFKNIEKKWQLKWQESKTSKDSYNMASSDFAKVWLRISKSLLTSVNATCFVSHPRANKFSPYIKFTTGFTTDNTANTKIKDFALLKILFIFVPFLIYNAAHPNNIKAVKINIAIHA